MDEEKEKVTQEEKGSDTPAEPQNKPTDEKQKKMIVTAIGYIPFGLLFFLPLLMYSEDKTAKFHANQALVLFLTGVIGGVVLGILGVIPGISVLVYILSSIFGVLLLILSILGILNVVHGEEKQLPLIGQFMLIK